MPKLEGIERDQIELARQSLNQVWENTYPIQAPFRGIGEYKTLQRYGFLGTLDYLVSRINEDGVLDTDAALQDRQKEPGFKQDLFERAVNSLVESWPEIASFIIRIG